MPPEIKLEPKRRTRKESLKEDLFRLLIEEEESDEFLYVVLKEAIEEGVFEDLKLHQKRMLFSHFAADAMMKCFEEMYCLCVANFNSYEISLLLHTACASWGSDEDALKMARLLLAHARKPESATERSYWPDAVAATVQHARLPIARALLTKWKEISVAQQKKTKDGKVVNTLATVLLREGVQHASVEAVRLALQSSCELPVEASLVVKAATHTASTILEMLLDAGADVESENAAGETPLLAAVKSGSLANVKFLIHTKKYCTRVLYNVYSAASVAIEYRRPEILKELGKSDGHVHLLACVRACVVVGDLDCFKILLSEMKKTYRAELNEVLICLVAHQKYEMLSFALFECPNKPEVMKINDFERLLKQATNDDIKSLLQKKIDIMNGEGESHVKVKEEQI